MAKVKETKVEREIRLSTEVLLLSFDFWCKNCFQEPRIKVLCFDGVLRLIIECPCNLGMKRVIHLLELVTHKQSTQRCLEDFVNKAAGEWKDATKNYVYPE